MYLRLLLAAGCLFCVSSITMRRIYTLFTEPKTWNEAKAICSDQFGQLVKIKGDTEIYELKYLDEFTWNYNLSLRLSTGLSFWSGHHRPLTNSSSVKFQDCEASGPILLASVGQRTCGSYGSTYTMDMSPCDETKMFICERYEGDCWYQPILNENSAITNVPDIRPISGIQAVDCAMACRNYTSGSGDECWAFLYRDDPFCVLYSFSDSFVAGSGAPVSTTSASAFYSYASNRAPPPASLVDYIFYVRTCFEGSLDMTTYDQYVNEGYYAETECATITRVINESLSDICFCETDEQPPIPKPISTAAKVDNLVKELTMSSSNTSAAQRKKTSAEDNRASAVGVGYVGVALMIGVFGGLFLMDVNLFIQSFKQLIIAFRTVSTP